MKLIRLNLSEVWFIRSHSSTVSKISIQQVSITINRRPRKLNMRLKEPNEKLLQDVLPVSMLAPNGKVARLFIDTMTVTKKTLTNLRNAQWLTLSQP